MNTDRTIILENVGDHTIGLGDGQGKVYVLQVGQKRRVSHATLQDIIDEPGTKIVFEDHLAKISNISRDELFNMGLTEDEIDLYLKEEEQPTIVIKEDLEDKEEKVIKVEKPAVKKANATTVKKSTTKKPSTKKIQQKVNNE